MGKLLELLDRYRASVKLDRGRCEGPNCSVVFSDDHPKGQRACSEECAEEAWWSRQVTGF